MSIRLSASSAVPIYRQIVDQVSQQIASGRLKPGDRLPSVREMARALPANQNTVLKAYEMLERDGLIERRHGDGTFIAEGGSPLRLSERRRRIADALTQAVVLARHYRLSDDEVRRALDEQLTHFPKATQE
ncbi:MAG: GntR family transcriptional regulator [Planctomycetes bacterium]|nr:GntR family transcriptional regulator [Planctomycetota bacterium]